MVTKKVAFYSANFGVGGLVYTTPTALTLGGEGGRELWEICRHSTWIVRYV